MIRYLVMLSLLLSAAVCAGLPEPDLPDGITSNWIARSMEYNGVEISMRSFHVKDQMNNVQGQFNAALQKLAGEVTVNERDGWIYLGSGDENWFYTVQLQSDLLGVKGVFTVSELPAKSRQGSAEVTASYPQGVRRVMYQRNRESSEEFSLEVLVTHAGLIGTRDIAISMFSEQGWKLMNTREQRLLFHKDNSRLKVFIQKREEAPGSLMLITREGNHGK